MAVNVPPVTFDRPVTVAPVRSVRLLEVIEVNAPPVAFRVPEVLVTPTVPPETFAVPAAPTVMLPRFADEASKPPVILARFVTEPAVSVAVPPVTFSELRTFALIRLPAVFTTFAVPPVKFAVALEPTVMFPSVALAVNVPPVTFERPVTVAPVRFVMLLEVIDENVPPVVFNIPEVIVVPMVPAEILAAPAAPRVRLPRFTDEASKPPVILARLVTDPPVSVDVPAVTLIELKTASLLKIPAEITTLAVPPVRLAVPLDPTVRFPKVILAVIVPAVTFDRPETVPAVKLVVPLVVRVFRVPPVTFKVPAELVAPVTVPPVIFAAPEGTFRLAKVALVVRLPPETVVEFADPPVRLADPEVTVKSPSVIFEFKLPPVTFERPVIFPPVKLVVPLVVNVLSVPLVRFKTPDELVAPVTLPPVTFAVPLVTARLSKVTFVVRVPPVTLERPVTVPPVRLVVPLVVKVLSVPPVRFKTPAELVAPVTLPPVRFAVPLVIVRLTKVALVVSVPPVTLESPVTVPPVRLVVPLVAKVFSVPPVRFSVPAEMVLPEIFPPVTFPVPPAPIVRLPKVILEMNVPAVTLAFPFTTPPDKFEVPPLTTNPFKVPPV